MCPPRDQNVLRARPDRISDIDVDVESHCGGGKCSLKADAGPIVFFLFADRDSFGTRCVEHQPVMLILWQLGVGNADDQGPDDLDVIGGVERSEVDVRGWTAKLIRREQHTALEDEVLADGRGRESEEKALERVEVQVLAAGAPRLSGACPQFQVGAAFHGGAGWGRCAGCSHSSTSRAFMSAGLARGKALATVISLAG